MQVDGINDTMVDLMADAFGALVVSTIGYIYVKTERRGVGVFDYLVKKFYSTNNSKR